MNESAEALVKSFTAKGYGAAFLEKEGSGDPFEVAHSIPGDRILFEITRKKRSPKKGRLLEILASSPDRVAPRCAHARTCGGCCWQQMDYPAQLRQKQQRVESAFFGHKAQPIIPCGDPWEYRNKMEFTFSENRAGARFLGLMIAQAEPYVFNVTECHLTHPWFTEVLAAVRAWWENSGLKAYHPPEDSGTLRYLTLREGIRTGQKMAVLNVSGNPSFAPARAQLDSFVEAVQEALKRAAVSVFLRVHQTKKGKPTQFYEMHLSGPDHIVEELHLRDRTFSFKISPISFFQPNTLQAEKLYDAALEFLKEGSLAYDLYCGTGTLGMAMSDRVEEIIGIELSPEAVIDAKENLARNQIENVQIYQGDTGQVLTRLMAEEKFRRPDTAIIDPPRAGLDPLALHHLKTLFPKNIIYISCNPLTQAENVKELLKIGYRIQRLQPIDQFPHTYHIENICFLER